MINSNFEVFKKEWIKEIDDVRSDNKICGNRFAVKILADWLDFDENSDGIILCDSSKEGGVDAVFFILDDQEGSVVTEGNNCYIVLSEYGSAFNNEKSIFEESKKVIEKLSGLDMPLTSISDHVITTVKDFIKKADENAKLSFIYATKNMLNESQKEAIKEVKILGKSILGNLFDVDAVSVNTIYNRLLDIDTRVQVNEFTIDGNFFAISDDAKIGVINLFDLFNFLNNYNESIGDLNQLYEKNIRKFFGAGRLINKSMWHTLLTDPEKFGLHYNGITIAALDISLNSSSKIAVKMPYIISGGQTTKTVWELFNRNFNAVEAPLNNSTVGLWWQKLLKSFVVIKLIKIDNSDNSLLSQITKFANSHDSVGRRDFIELERSLRTYSKQVEHKYNLFLEIYRGGWNFLDISRPPNGKSKFSGYANVFDLFKIYYAGWIGDPEFVYGMDSPYVPGGFMFKKVIDSHSFDSEDFYAMYLLKKIADKAGFGRLSAKQSRLHTRFLFYYVILNLLKDIIVLSKKVYNQSALTNAVVKVFFETDSNAAELLTNQALKVVDDYYEKELKNELYKSSDYVDIKTSLKKFLNNYNLNIENIQTPQLEHYLSLNKFLMNQSPAGEKSTRQVVLEVLNKITS